MERNCWKFYIWNNIRTILKSCPFSLWNCFSVQFAQRTQCPLYCWANIPGKEKRAIRISPYHYSQMYSSRLLKSLHRRISRSLKSLDNGPKWIVIGYSSFPWSFLPSLIDENISKETKKRGHKSQNKWLFTRTIDRISNSVM